MSKAAIWSDEKTTNEAVQKAVRERQEFLQWWREWATPRNVDTAWVREMAHEAWKAGRRSE
jgi:hypothetical protein